MSEQSKKPCPVCGRYENRVMTVDAVVLDNGRVLLVKRKNEPFKGRWALPGGYMDFNESARTAAHRELEEETGLSAQASDFIGLFDDPIRHPQQVVSAAYVVTRWQGTVQAGDDADQAAWFPAEALPEELAFDHDKIIETAL